MEETRKYLAIYVKINLLTPNKTFDMKFTEKYPGELIRALSWKQPYAGLMLRGKIETRTWDTPYRGWVLICASSKGYTFTETTEISGWGMAIPIDGWRHKNKKSYQDGKAIAVGRLVDSRVMDFGDENKTYVKFKEPWQEENKKTGKVATKMRWCHVYAEVQPIVPFEWKGKQGWSTLNEEQMDKIILL